MQLYRYGSNHSYIIRRFRCTICGNIMTAAKRAKMATRPGHIKHMYCPVCRETTEHKQLKEWEGEEAKCKTF